MITSGTWVLPLARELQYEFSALLALSLSLLAGLAAVTAGELHPLRWRIPLPPDAPTGHPPSDGSDDDRRGLHRLVATVVMLSLAPLAVEILHALATGECGLIEGTAWYLLLAPPAAVISLLIGLLCRMMTRRRWLRVLLFLLIWSGSLLRGAVEAYTGPHIYLYAWQVGFFPGGSWDPELPITLRLILYRLAQLALAGGLFTVIVELRRATRDDTSHGDTSRGDASRLSMPSWRLPAPVVYTGLVATAALALIPFRAELGLTRTNAWLRQQLGDSLATRHAIIYFDRAATDSLSLWRAARMTDFYIERHAALLGIAPARVGRISFYLHPSAERQKEYVGTSSASFTKPWARMLNIPQERVGDVLEHELAHIVIAPFGRVLGISLSQGLLEGAAVAMTGDEGWLTLHEYAGAAYHELSPPSIDRIMGTGGFTSINTSLAYLLAGSFSRWLIDTYGIRRYLALYGSGDYEKIYGAPLATMAARYRAFLETELPPVPPSADMLRYYYGGGSFFAQRCLRRLATLNRRGYDRLAEERYDEAIDAFRESMEEGISTSARLGVLRSLAGLGRYRTVLDSMRVYLADSLWQPFLPSLLDAGDAHWALGRLDSASGIYRRALGYGVSTTLGTRAALRLYFIQASPPLAAAMRTYFTRSLDPVERVDLLRRARRLATDARERRVLDLMAASWTYARYPKYTLAGLVDDSLAGSRSMRPPAPPPASERETLALFAEESLRHTLADLSLIGILAQTANGGADDDPSSGAIDAGFPSVELRRAVAIWLPGTPLPSPRSQNEERTERRALIEFARRHPVLP